MRKNWFKLIFAVALIAAVACLAAGCESTADDSEYVEKKLLYSDAYVTNDVIDGLPFLDFSEVEQESKANYRGNGVFRADGTPVSMELSYYYRNVYTGRESSYEFDDDGRLMLAKSWMSDGKESETTVYTYDDHGRCISYVRTNAEGAVTYRRENEYDAKGNMVRYLAYNGNDEICDKREYEYDTNGNLIKEIQYAQFDINLMIGWREYEYDDSGNRVRMASFNSDGIKTHEEVMEYNKKDKMISKSLYSEGDVSPYVKYEYEYDRKGNLVKENYIRIFDKRVTEYGADEKKVCVTNYRDGFLSSVIEYDEYGYESSITAYNIDDGEIKSLHKYTNDRFGNIIKYFHMTRDGMVEHVKYEYDAQGYRTKGVFLDKDGKIREILHYDIYGREICRDIYKSGSVTGCEKYVYSDPVYTGDIDFPLTSVKLRTEYCNGAGVVQKYIEHDGRVNRTYNSGGVLILLEEQGEYEFIDGKAVRYDTLTEYRPNGTVASVTVVDKDGEIVSQVKYDAAGNKIE